MPGQSLIPTKHTIWVFNTKNNIFKRRIGFLAFGEQLMSAPGKQEQYDNQPSHISFHPAGYADGLHTFALIKDS